MDYPGTMNCNLKRIAPLLSILLVAYACGHPGKTTVGISGEEILLNGKPTLEGIAWRGIQMEGLLPNARLVQGIFDDLNPETVSRWKYPDTGEWDPDRNTAEFVAAMPVWREHGLLGFTINLQGGSPEGYSRTQPWYNSAIDSLGNLREAYMLRLGRIMDKADELGMVTILGIFRFPPERGGVRSGIPERAGGLVTLPRAEGSLL